MVTKTNKLLVFASIIITVISLGGCNRSDTAKIPVADSSKVTSQDGSAEAPATLPGSHTLTVFAAASLTGAFQDIGREFEAANPTVRVNINFAGSQILRTQLEQGAVADVFASADYKNIELLVTDHLVAGNAIQEFASNSLIVILPNANPGKVIELADLAKPKLKIVLADVSVPAGNYARQVLNKMSQDPKYGAEFLSRVLSNVVSNETDVKQVVTKVELGEADAGIVYVSDAVASPELMTLSIPADFNIIARYPIALLSNATEPRLAADFVTYVRSTAGQQILEKWGFNPATH